MCFLDVALTDGLWLQGVDNGPVGSCARDCKISATVNSDFERDPDAFWGFGGGIPGLPGIQTVNRACTTFGCNVESACGYILDCFDEARDPFETTFPISAEDPLARQISYQCLVDYSAATRAVQPVEPKGTRPQPLPSAHALAALAAAFRARFGSRC